MGEGNIPNIKYFRLFYSCYWMYFSLRNSFSEFTLHLSRKECKMSVLVSDFNKVKVMVQVNFTLEQTTKPQMGVEVQLYSFFNFGARWGGR